MCEWEVREMTVMKINIIYACVKLVYGRYPKSSFQLLLLIIKNVINNSLTDFNRNGCPLLP